MKMKKVTRKIIKVFSLWGLFSFAGVSMAFAGVFDLENEFKFGIGLGYNGNYLNQGSTLSVLGAHFGGGGFEETLKSRDARDNDVRLLRDSDQGLSEQQGGCPEAFLKLEAHAPIQALSGSDQKVAIDPNFLEFRGNNCSASSGSGASSALNGFDVDLQVQYNIFPWLFVRTGGIFGFALPVEYSLNFEYTGALQTSLALGRYENGQRVGDYTVGGVPQTIDANTLHKLASSIQLSYSGYHFQVPVLLGFTLFENETSSVYFSAGVNISFARYNKKVSSSQAISINPDDVAGFSGLDIVQFNEEDVENNVSTLNLGLLWILGAEKEILKDVSLYAEVRWLEAISSNAKISGTEHSANSLYASDTYAAKMAQSVAPDAVPNALQTDSDPQGRSTRTDINLGYVRWLVGVNYRLAL